MNMRYQSSMLNKNICKRCYKKIGWKWHNHDEDLWEVEKIGCTYWMTDEEAYLGYDAEVLSFKEAYERCKYKLEHVVLNNEKN